MPKVKPSPIDDPPSDASRREGEEFRLVRQAEPFAQKAAFHTTGEFQNAGKKYRSHCVPTALTNVLLTLYGLYGYEGLAGLSPEQVYRTCADIGQKHLMYWNMSLLGRIGGTSILLAVPYAKLCLKKFGIDDISPSMRLFTTPGAARRELKKGNLLMAALWHHPLYKNHMVTAYGYEIVQSRSGALRHYLLIADGWAAQKRYLSCEQSRVISYITFHKREGGKKA